MNLLGPIDELTAPEFVLNLEVSDETIKERIMNLPESMISGTKYSEEGINQKQSMNGCYKRYIFIYMPPFLYSSH